MDQHGRPIIVCWSALVPMNRILNETIHGMSRCSAHQHRSNDVAIDILLSMESFCRNFGSSNKWWTDRSRSINETFVCYNVSFINRNVNKRSAVDGIMYRNMIRTWWPHEIFHFSAMKFPTTDRKSLDMSRNHWRLMYQSIVDWLIKEHSGLSNKGNINIQAGVLWFLSVSSLTASQLMKEKNAGRREVKKLKKQVISFL